MEIIQQRFLGVGMRKVTFFLKGLTARLGPRRTCLNVEQAGLMEGQEVIACRQAGSEPG